MHRSRYASWELLRADVTCGRGRVTHGAGVMVPIEKNLLTSHSCGFQGPPFFFFFFSFWPKCISCSNIKIGSETKNNILLNCRLG